MPDYVPLEPEHLLAIEPKESQKYQYGIALADLSWADASALAAQDNCWAVLRGKTVIACLGINETFSGMQGVAWAFFGASVGRDYVGITQFARDRIIGASKLARIEAIVRCAELEDFRARTVEALDDEMLWLEPGRMLRRALAEATPEVNWAIKVGLKPVAVLGRFGAASETHMLLERILPVEGANTLNQRSARAEKAS